MSNENQSPKLDDTGIRAYRPNEKAPSFVKSNITIDVEQLNDYCNAHPEHLTQGNDGKWRVKLQILEKKDGSGYYAKIDDFKPKS